MTHYKDYDLYYQFNQDSFYVKAIDTNTFMSYENTIDYILFSYKQYTIKNIFDKLLTDKNICIDFIIIPKMLTMKCSYCNDIVDITFDLILNYTEIDEKSIMITKLMEENKKLQLEKGTQIDELHKQVKELKLEKETHIDELHKQVKELKLEKDTSFPQLNWELELERILKTFLNPIYGDTFKKAINNIFSEISNSIKIINIDETIYSICYYSHVYNTNINHIYTWVLSSKLFLITNKNIYKVHNVYPTNTAYHIFCEINTSHYGLINGAKHEFVKCKSINEDISLTSIVRYILATSGDKTRTVNQQSDLNGNTTRIILNELEKLKKYNYNIYWKILNTKDYGIPQNRERIFIIGTKYNFEWPEKQPMDKLENYIDYEDNNKREAPNCSLTLFNNIPKNAIYINLCYPKSKFINSSVYTPTITCSNRIWNVKLSRYSNLNECLKLQGFDVTFNYVISKTQIKKQIGNSINVNVLKAIIFQIF